MKNELSRRKFFKIAATTLPILGTIALAPYIVKCSKQWEVYNIQCVECSNSCANTCRNKCTTTCHGSCKGTCVGTCYGMATK